MYRLIQLLARRIDTTAVVSARCHLRRGHRDRSVQSPAEMAAAAQDGMTTTHMTTDKLPVIDITNLSCAGTRELIDAACREWGFFQVTGHGVEEHLISTLRRQMHLFFGQSMEAK